MPTESRKRGRPRKYQESVNESSTHKLVATVSDELYEKLNDYSADTRLSKTAIIEFALVEYINRHPVKKIELK